MAKNIIKVLLAMILVFTLVSSTAFGFMGHMFWFIPEANGGDVPIDNADLNIDNADINVDNADLNIDNADLNINGNSGMGVFDFGFMTVNGMGFPFGFGPGPFNFHIDEEDDDAIIPEEWDPVAKAGGPYTGEIGEEIVFDGSNSYDPDGIIVQYRWELGNGIDSYQAYSRRTYDHSGLYAVRLTVTDNDGRTDSEIVYVVITGYDDDEDEESTTVVIDNKLAVKAKITGDDYLSAGDLVVIRTHIENVGNEDLKDVKVTAVIQDLAIRDAVGISKLKDGDELSKNLYLEMPENTPSGAYDIRITYSNDILRRVIYREITVV